MPLNKQQQSLYRAKADILAAAGHPIRLAIIEHLADGEKCVCDIVEDLGAGQPNVSRHLAILHQAGLVTRRKEGLRVIYSLETPCILGFLDCVTELLKRRLAGTRELLKRL